MRFAILVHATKESEAGVLPTSSQLTQMGHFNEELVKAGALLAADGMQATSKGARLRFSGGKATVADGPFPGSADLIAGFWIVQGKSKEEIIELFSRAPMEEGQTIEVRQLFEADDFGENLTPEARSQEERLRSGRS